MVRFFLFIGKGSDWMDGGSMSFFYGSCCGRGMDGWMSSLVVLTVEDG